MQINPKAIRKLTGRNIYVINKKGLRISGKLVKVSGNKLYLQPNRVGKKHVMTNAIIPLVLFDLLAVGTSPFGYGGYGGYNAYGAGYPGIGYGGYPGYY